MDYGLSQLDKYRKALEDIASGDLAPYGVPVDSIDFQASYEDFVKIAMEALSDEETTQKE